MFHVAKMLRLCHEDHGDKRYEMEMSWLTEGTKFQQEMVPKELRDKAIKEAISKIEEEQMGEEQ